MTTQLLEHLQRQSPPGKTTGLGTHPLAHQTGHVAARRVAVQDLKRTALERCGRIQFTPPPCVSHSPADWLDCLDVQCTTNILRDLHSSPMDTDPH